MKLEYVAVHAKLGWKLGLSHRFAGFESVRIIRHVKVHAFCIFRKNVLRK